MVQLIFLYSRNVHIRIVFAKNPQIPVTGLKTCFKTDYKNCDTNPTHQILGHKHLLLNFDNHPLISG